MPLLRVNTFYKDVLKYLASGRSTNMYRSTGISGVIHAASDMSFRPDPNEVIPPMVSGTLNLLDAAARHPEVKRVVLTSSCLAAASPELGVGRTINKNTWNETAIRQAWAPPPYDQSRGFIVYAASKAQSEKDAWKWYEDHNPQFVLNAGQEFSPFLTDHRC